MRVAFNSICFWAGPIGGLLLVLSGPPEGVSFAAWGTAGLLVWMAIWWASEAIPIPATSLLPLIFLPLFGAGTAQQAAAAYASPIVLLLLGGFIIAIGIERWDLHKRIALNILIRLGSNPRTLLAGFMIATAALSMWISNTATTLMMLPIALSVAASAKTADPDRLTLGLLLGIAYAASIGGVATPIGTPTNLIALNALQEISGVEISFATWLQFGVPALVLLLPTAWFLLSRSLSETRFGKAASAPIRAELDGLGALTAPEVRLICIFSLVASLWIARVFIQEHARSIGFTPDWLMNISDMGIAIFGAVLMFIVPASGGHKRALLNWEDTKNLPWGVLVLFGGGISLGRAMTRTGLSDWIGRELEVLSILPPLLFIAAIVALVIFLTELTSNVATMTTLAPILGVLALAVGASPASLLAPTAVAASCAFMLPVATAPNAIVYATGQVPVARMMTAGLKLNLVSILFITAIGYMIAPYVLG